MLKQFTGSLSKNILTNNCFPSVGPSRSYSSIIPGDGSSAAPHDEGTPILSPTGEILHPLPTQEEASDKSPVPINQIVTYNEICRFENLEQGLKRTKSGVSAGLDGEIKATFTNSKLEKLAEDLKSHNFKATPIKKV
jgi:hypothetical protein